MPTSNAIFLGNLATNLAREKTLKPALEMLDGMDGIEAVYLYLKLRDRMSPGLGERLETALRTLIERR